MSVGLRRAGWCACAFVLVSVVPARADWEAARLAYDREDYVTAFQEVKRLAEHGHAKAQALLGLMYQLGRGLPRDLDQAMKWYQAAAEQGDADGELHLGTMFLNGSGAERDTARGLLWLKRAAGHGSSDACVIL